MIAKNLVLLSLLLAASPAFLSAETSDWPGYLGPTRDGRTTSWNGELAGATTVQFATLWRRPLGSGYSGVAVGGGRAFTMYSDGTSDVLEAMDTTTGRKLWTQKLAETLKGRGGAADGPTGTPTLAGNVVFALGPKGQMIAAQASTGKVLWQRNLVRELGANVPDWGVSSSPLVVGETVVILVGGEKHGTVCALAAADGETVWCAGDTATGYQSPMLLKVGDSEHLVVTSNTHLYGLDPESGKSRWSFLYEPKGGEGSSHPVTVGEDRLLIETEAGFKLLKIYPATQGVVVKQMWTSTQFKDSFAVPLAHGDALFGYRGSIFSCLDAGTGELNWQSRGPGEGEAVLIDDLIVTWGMDGKLRVVAPDARAYRELTSHQVLDRGSYTTPAYANGVLYVRNLEEIAAVRIAPASTRVSG
ncbi:MAG: PQQ-like beta-propeller repeat protein [Acidobacteriota bacterium]|nr:PQQ-like beta-propeller repeat protein [Acidobacteriota bacterium]